MKRRRRKDKLAMTANSSEDSAFDPRSLAPLASVVVLTLLLGASVFGLERLKARVQSLPEFKAPVKVVLDGAPDWVDREGWTPRILKSVSLPTAPAGTGRSPTEQVYDQLARSGWVSEVRRVWQDMEGVIHVTCDYRRPIAMVHADGVYIPIDKDGVRLPEEYPAVADDSGWMRINGVESKLPVVGKPFAGEDAVAAVRLAGLIFDQDFAMRITGINVANFRGRKNKRENHIELLTRDGGHIEWGSAIGEEIEEPSAADKLRNIAVYFKKGSPQAQVDVSVYRTGWIEPQEPVVRTVEGPARRGR